MANESRPLTYNELKSAVAGNAAAIRFIMRLESTGGPEDKVFPPTYAGGVYAFENRRSGDKVVRVVLIDSVQSQANRLELALQEAYDDGLLSFPLVAVDFTKVGISEPARITTLQAPHRIADAIFRDSLLGKVPFRDSGIGKRFAAAKVDNATALYELCPTALVFGVWDSTGAEGGLGNKFARALVSEIIGIDAVPGVRTSSRVDPLQIEKCKLYEHKDSTDQNKFWTVNEEEAKQERDDKGNPVVKHGRPVLIPYKRKKADKGKPSEINHGNVTPDFVRYAERVNVADPLRSSEVTVNYSIETEEGDVKARSAVKTSDASVRAGDIAAGGVTISHALQTTVLSLPALRRLRFPATDGKSSSGRNDAARTVLAALALVAVTQQRQKGYFLRSRCDLIPATDNSAFEIVITATKKDQYSLSADGALEMFKLAVTEAERHHLPWPEEPISLTPKDAFAQLVKRSRELAAVVAEGEE